MDIILTSCIIVAITSVLYMALTPKGTTPTYQHPDSHAYNEECPVCGHEQWHDDDCALMLRYKEENPFMETTSV